MLVWSQFFQWKRLQHILITGLFTILVLVE